MPLLDGTTKKRPVMAYHCAGCGQDISQEAAPFAIRIAAFTVPQAVQERDLERIPFDTTDIGLPPLIRELIDQGKHPDGHVYLSAGCFAALFEQRLVTADGTDVASVVPMRAELDAEGIANTAFTGREHRTEPTLFNSAGMAVNADGSPFTYRDGSPWVAPALVPAVLPLAP